MKEALKQKGEETVTQVEAGGLDRAPHGSSSLDGSRVQRLRIRSSRLQRPFSAPRATWLSRCPGFLWSRALAIPSGGNAGWERLMRRRCAPLLPRIVWIALRFLCRYLDFIKLTIYNILNLFYKRLQTGDLCLDFNDFLFSYLGCPVSWVISCRS